MKYKRISYGVGIGLMILVFIFSALRFEKSGYYAHNLYYYIIDPFDIENYAFLSMLLVSVLIILTAVMGLIFINKLGKIKNVPILHDGIPSQRAKKRKLKRIFVLDIIYIVLSSIPAAMLLFGVIMSIMSPWYYFIDLSFSFREGYFLILSCFLALPIVVGVMLGLSENAIKKRAEELFIKTEQVYTNEDKSPLETENIAPTTTNPDRPSRLSHNGVCATRLQKTKAYLGLIPAIILVFAFAFTFASAASTNFGGTYGLSYIDSTGDYNSYTVSGIGTATAKNIKIPARYDGSQVIGIGSNAFKNCTNIKSIKIPWTIYDIGGCNAYYGYRIDENVFSGCTNLEKITVAKTNTYFTSVDGVLFSKDKTVLIAYPAGKPGASYHIPSSVKSINPLAFDGCTNLEKITVAKTNPHFTLVDGVLFSKDKSLLAANPSGRTGIYSVP